MRNDVNLMNAGIELWSKIRKTMAQVEMCEIVVYNDLNIIFSSMMIDVHAIEYWLAAV